MRELPYLYLSEAGNGNSPVKSKLRTEDHWQALSLGDESMYPAPSTVTVFKIILEEERVACEHEHGDVDSAGADGMGTDLSPTSRIRMFSNRTNDADP